MIFKPNRRNKDFLFLPDPILPGWLKILHLNIDSPVFSDYEIDQFRKPETGPGSIPHTKEEAKKSGMNENEWRNAGQTQPQDDKPYWAKVNFSHMSPKLVQT